MALTVVEDPDRWEPGLWNDAARICVYNIFDYINNVQTYLSGLGPAAPASADIKKPEKSESFIESSRQNIKLIDAHFEGMVNNMMFFSSDEIYWVEEWRILGAIAAAAGIKIGIFNAIAPAPREAAGTQSSGKLKKAEALSIDKDADLFIIQEMITSTLVHKQHDYGHENIARFGRQGLIVRVHDKIARLKNLSLSDRRAKNEAIEDTYMDIIGYCAIGMMWERGWFLLELGAE